MATYRQASDDALSLVEEIMGQFRQDLVEARVTVETLFAHAARDKETGEPKGDALKHNGYKAAGLIKVNSLKDRVAGCKDVRLILDGDAWDSDWTDERKRAVIHHELLHPELLRDESGAVKLDDAFRPRLKNRLHDVQLGGFYEIMERYGEAAPETEIALDLGRRMKQMDFAFEEQVA